MVSEDYCSYEVSKLLKEKGFNEICEHYIDDDDEMYKENGVLQHQPCRTSDLMFGIMCPTHQMALKWLREKWIFIEISFSVTLNGEPCYDFGILSRSAQWIYRSKQPFSTYEEAVEAALKYSLGNLI